MAGGNGHGNGEAAAMAATAERTLEIHEALVGFLRQRFPQDHPVTIITACSYEIGRLVGLMADGMTEQESEDMMRGVAAVMRAHVKSGLRR